MLFLGFPSISAILAAAQVVRQRGRELRQRRGNVEEHLELVLLLVRALAAIQNTARAPGLRRSAAVCGHSEPPGA